MDLKKACEKAGVTLVEKPNGHCQLKGGLLVNYYPYSKTKTAYVAGTTGGKKHTTTKEAIAMCFNAPQHVNKKDRAKRSSNTRKQRKAMIKKGITSCYWCSCDLNLDTSTVEHKIPLARGGLDNPNNRTLACEPCNKGRGSNMPELTTH